MKNTLASTFTKPFLASLLACTGAAALARPGTAQAQTTTRNTAVVNVSHNFVTTTGDTAFTGVIKGSDGNFYGTTTEGGSTNAGVIYKYTPDYHYSVFHDFKDDAEATPVTTEGQQPGPIIMGKDGNLYGVCIGGGKDTNTPDGGGTVFKISLADGKYTKLYDFDNGKSTDSWFPVALVQGSDGNLYGLSRVNGAQGEGDGVYWRLSLDGKTFKQLYFFNSNHGGLGYEPRTQMCVGKDGNFYGTTFAGATGADGTPGNGAIFKATIGGSVTLVHAFLGGADEPDSPPGSVDNALIQGKDGLLYGASTTGGQQDFGTIFKCTTGGQLTILHDFMDTNDGKEPSGPLVQGSDGNFYGGLRAGFPPAGSDEDGPGGLYQIKSSGSYTLLHKFSAANAGAPVQSFGGLTEVTQGHFASVTAGGTNQVGVIIKMTVSPMVTSAASATATQGQPFTYQIKATNSPTQYGVSGIAAGLHVDSTTGLISGMSSNVGTKTMTLKALNGAGTGELTLTLTTKAP